MMTVGRSKTGLPTITESGGGSSNTGYACIVCGPNGEKVKPLFVPRGYSNGDHAIFVARPGMCIVSASHSRRGESAAVSRIVEIIGDELKLEAVGEWEDGDGNIPEQFEAAQSAAMSKAHDYHCRRAFYIG